MCPAANIICTYPPSRLLTADAATGHVQHVGLAVDLQQLAGQMAESGATRPDLSLAEAPTVGQHAAKFTKRQWESQR